MKDENTTTHQRRSVAREAPMAIEVDDVVARRAAGAVLLDSRESAIYAAQHLRGALNVGLERRFTDHVTAVLPTARDIVLVGDPVAAPQTAALLRRAGYSRVIGQLNDPAHALMLRPELAETSTRLTIEQLGELSGLEPELQIVDVRHPDETAAGTLPGAREIPLEALIASLAGLDATLPVLIYSGGGHRSQIAASVLMASGFVEVADLLGGFDAWAGAGLPTSTAGPAARTATTPQVSARVASALVESGAALLDVREPSEWESGHAPEAMHMPMSQVKDRLGELPRDRKIVVVCRSGGRSAAVTQSLRVWGFDAVNLVGGMSAWNAAVLPMVIEPPVPGLVVHSRDPLNCETPLAALIGGVVMPNARFYVRNHFANPRIDVRQWHLQVRGHVDRTLRLTMHDLRGMHAETRVVTLECAGNGRSFFNPPVAGEQWRLGAVSTAEWTGVPLVDVLDRAGIRAEASHVVFRGADHGAVEGSPTPIQFERALTLDEALAADALLAYAMNGEPLPGAHGFPLRAIVPRWYAVASVKWLMEIDLVGAPFAGFFQSARYFFEWQRGGETVRCACSACAR